MAAGCARLVHPQVTGEARARQARLMGVLLLAPFVASAAIFQTFSHAYGVPGALAALCAAFATSWLVAFLVASSRKALAAEIAALTAGSILVAALVALAGGAGTAMAALVAALPLEARWVTRSRRVTAIAAAAAAAVLAGGVVFGAGGPIVGSAWLWLSPVLYGLTVMVRMDFKTQAAAAAEDKPFVLPENCLDAMVARLNEGGEIEHVSPRGGVLLGVEPTLLLGSGLFERIHVADRVDFLCAIARTRSEDRPSRCDLRIRMPQTQAGQGGGYRSFEAEFVKPSVEDATVVAIIRDGGEKVALRAKLADAIEQAGATEVAKGRFLAAVSHELRTPLNAIIGFSDMLLHRDISGSLDPKQAEHVTVIREAGGHLLSVVNAILDVSKIESGSYEINCEPFDLKPVVDLSCAMLAPQAAEKGVAVASRLPAQLGQIAGDQRAVQQILINLVSNAVKFTPDGGKVTIAASRNEGMAQLLVSDTGIGICADDLTKLGRPFMQVQNDYTRQFQGTGLGLSLVKGLVKLHGGTMSIESAPGLGTTVTIGLPLAEGTKEYGTDNAGGTEEGYGIALRKIA